MHPRKRRSKSRKAPFTEKDYHGFHKWEYRNRESHSGPSTTAMQQPLGDSELKRVMVQHASSIQEQQQQNDLRISEDQERICASLDQWHKNLACRNCTSGPRLKCDSLVCMEVTMKYWTAKICIVACNSRDESVYDCFKEYFNEIVALAKSTLANCLETVEPTHSEFDFDKSSYLSLLEFVIFKCRWLDIRYAAWLVLERLAARQNLVTCARIYTIGKRMMEIEHNPSIGKEWKCPAFDYCSDAAAASFNTLQRG
ncbi:hypothetical protein LZ31DRAFT_601461 [Colletotrichum somersetense]|nr:hypothetical protein LZ31DRAFT_601461 [Colletotrichum somersetense]